MAKRIITLAISWLVLSLFLAGLVIVFAQSREQKTTPIHTVEGANIFRDFCASCHGPNGRGNGPVSKTLKEDVPDLTALSRRNGGKFPTSRVRNTLMFGGDQLQSAHGSKAMPIWGPIFHAIEFDQDLGNVRLENVTKYLESIQRK
jgi:mono/diheme cytochrome c family protein